jgi:hypothetical protein
MVAVERYSSFIKSSTLMWCLPGYFKPLPASIGSGTPVM